MCGQEVLLKTFGCLQAGVYVVHVLGPASGHAHGGGGWRRVTVSGSVWAMAR